MAPGAGVIIVTAQQHGDKTIMRADELKGVLDKLLRQSIRWIGDDRRIVAFGLGQEVAAAVDRLARSRSRFLALRRLARCRGV
jgi:hypothetical protein